MKKFVLVISYDNTDPDVYGPFDSKKAAREYSTKITAKWDDRDWYHAGGGHGVKITTITK